jgi:hypothetical protein
MILNHFARHRWTRVALIPVILGIDGWKCLKWVLHLTSNEQDLGRTENVMGWLDPRLDKEWDRLTDPKHPDYGSFRHSASNMAAERAKLDPQRTAKTAGLWFSAFIVTALIAVVAVLI